MLPLSSPYCISRYRCQRASPSTAPALAVCELRVDGRGSSLPRGDRMRLTRSGAALQSRRARAPDDLRYRGSSRSCSEPNSARAGAEVLDLWPPARRGPGNIGTGVCWFQNKVGLGWHAGARRPSYFPGLVPQAAREGHDGHLEAEVQAPKEDHRDRKAKPASGRRGPQAQSLPLCACHWTRLGGGGAWAPA